MAQLIFRPCKAAMHVCVCVCVIKVYWLYIVYVDCRVEMLLHNMLFQGQELKKISGEKYPYPAVPRSLCLQHLTPPVQKSYIRHWLLQQCWLHHQHRLHLLEDDLKWLLRQYLCSGSGCCLGRLPAQQSEESLEPSHHHHQRVVFRDRSVPLSWPRQMEASQ